jgi:uncharacterized protein
MNDQAEAPEPAPAPRLVSPTPPPLAPVAKVQRISSVDVLRGVALLGILPVNMTSFAMPMVCYMNPTKWGEFRGYEVIQWAVVYIVFEFKMITLFSMLFGAGMVLQTERAAAVGQSTTWLLVRRLLWLLIIGLIHAYGFWIGDILVGYAILGLVVLWMRHWSARTQALVGITLMLMQIPIMSGMGWAMNWQANQVRAIEAGTFTGTAAEKEQLLAAWNEAKEFLAPSPEQIRKEVHDQSTESFLARVQRAAPEVLWMQIMMVLVFGLTRISGNMLVGMALMKSGVFAAAQSTAFYAWCVAGGYLIGLPLVAFGAYDLAVHNFDPMYNFKVGGLYNYVGSVFVALGHMGVVMLLCKADVLGWLKRSLAAVGQMALTNYLTHTLVCTFIFNGWGLGQFGSWNRAQQTLLVLAIWAMQMVVSPWWLGRFRFGPMEWVWRSLTYGRLQPFRRTEGATDASR